MFNTCFNYLCFLHFFRHVLLGFCSVSSFVIQGSLGPLISELLTVTVRVTERGPVTVTVTVTMDSDNNNDSDNGSVNDNGNDTDNQ